LEARNMLVDDKLRNVLVESAKELGISASLLVDWARTLIENWEARTPNEGGILASVVLDMVRDGDLKITGISNQRPVLTLTEQGQRTGDILLEDSAATKDTADIF
jgi:hypothetical protein